MKIFWTIIIIAVLVIAGILIFGGTGSPNNGGNNATSTASSTPQTGGELALSQSYSSPNYGFSINYASEMGFLVKKEQIESLGYIPLCDPETSLVCVVYPESLLPGRNFQGGGVSVAIVNDKKTEAACTAGPTNGEQEKLLNTIIDGKQFVTYEYEDAAAGHQVKGVDYRGFVNGRCYQIGTRLATTTFENYASGTIQRFTPQEREQVESVLNRVVNSIKFL